MLRRGGTIRLQIHSNFEMVDFVQVVSDRAGQLAGLDEDTVHWIGVAVRESVINAIKHGNREEYGKLVTVEFTFASSIRVRASTPRKSPTRWPPRTS
jgi:serine/threonine-protein kinase RsbW